MYMYIWVYIYTYAYVHIYIYIYIFMYMAAGERPPPSDAPLEDWLCVAFGSSFGSGSVRTPIAPGRSWTPPTLAALWQPGCPR